MKSQQIIESLGLNENQADVYMTLLQMGSGRIQDIAKKSGVKRTTTYSILDALIQRGFVTYEQIKGHREYYIENPKKIPTILDQEIESIKYQKNNVVDFLPELLSLYNSHSTKPRIRTYEGLDGIKSVFEEILLLPKGTETLAYASYQTIHGNLKEWLKLYIERRAKQGITQRCIAEDSPEAREDLIKNDERDLRVTRLVSKEKFPFVCDQINIFGNKMFIASYTDMLAVVIESEAISTTMKTIFELAWLGASK